MMGKAYLLYIFLLSDECKMMMINCWLIYSLFFQVIKKDRWKWRHIYDVVTVADPTLLGHLCLFLSPAPYALPVIWSVCKETKERMQLTHFGGCRPTIQKYPTFGVGSLNERGLWSDESQWELCNEMHIPRSRNSALDSSSQALHWLYITKMGKRSVLKK